MSAPELGDGSPSLQASHLRADHTASPAASREDITGVSYQSAPEDHILPPPNFRPFFTLVEDAASGEHHHPAVHYFFSDDDPEGLTSTIIESLHPNQEDPNHRVLLLDIGRDGRTVTSSHSLNSVWQISNTSMVPAPSWTESGPETASEGLMLRVEGQEAPKQSEREQRHSTSDDVIHRLESDVEIYMDRLGHLQTVLAKSEVV